MSEMAPLPWSSPGSAAGGCVGARTPTGSSHTGRCCRCPGPGEAQNRQKPPDCISVSLRFIGDQSPWHRNQAQMCCNSVRYAAGGALRQLCAAEGRLSHSHYGDSQMFYFEDAFQRPLQVNMLACSVRTQIGLMFISCGALLQQFSASCRTGAVFVLVCAVETDGTKNKTLSLNPGRNHRC